jgi:hypothetical protein
MHEDGGRCWPSIVCCASRLASHRGANALVGGRSHCSAPFTITAAECYWASLFTAAEATEHSACVMVDRLGIEPSLPKRQLYRLPRVLSGITIHGGS